MFILFSLLLYLHLFFFLSTAFYFLFFFFFQAEDGIRDADVTGVQTCALPILGRASWLPMTLTAPWRGWISFIPTSGCRWVSQKKGGPSGSSCCCPIRSIPN